MSLLSKKLENDSGNNNLVKETENEIRALHQIFVTWFRGEKPMEVLKKDLNVRMAPQFSHVAPNGHMVQGRDVLVQYLADKYACYQDRVFSIDVYNVQVLWSTSNQVLASYEEWQSWDDENKNDDESEEEDTTNTTESGGKQQFGRLSTCLLERTSSNSKSTKSSSNNNNNNNNKFRWIHVHETWMEAEEPTVKTNADGVEQVADEDTVMTGPVPPSEAGKSRYNSAPPASSNSNVNPLLKPSNDDDTTEEDDDDVGNNNNTNINNNNNNIKKPVLIVLINSKTLSLSEDQQQTKSQDILTEVGVDYEVIDGSHHAQIKKRMDLFEISKQVGTYPQFFLVTTNNDGKQKTEFWGTWEDLELSHKNGTLVEDIETPLPEEDEDEEEEDSDEDEEEAADTVASLPKIQKKPVEVVEDDIPPNERKFLEASQGILFFEEDDGKENSNNNQQNQQQLHTSGAENSAFVDGMMETENDNDAGGAGNNNINNNIDNAVAMNVMNSSAAMLSLNSASGASHKRHVSSKLDQYAKPLLWENSLVGVSIAGFDIGTGQGPIADSNWYTEKESTLEALAQHRGSNGKRKLVLPEMVFSVAHVAMEGHGIWLSWDAIDCLSAWASAHEHIPLHSSTAEYMGVSVLKSKDAELWKNKRTTSGNNNNNKSSTDSSAVYHYDWTYSSPFSVKAEGGEWIELDESGMRMELLKDQSVPILFFDEIVLYEDDLHDNGQVQYSIKLRIMPTCAYILSRLFVRVDKVLVRVRETRLLVDFFGIQPQIYRDITWRECSWDDLITYNLPDTVRSWNFEQTGETPEFNNQLQKLPEIELPTGFQAHSVFEYGF